MYVALEPADSGIKVTWHLDGVSLQAGDPIGQLPLSMAGAPTLELGTGDIAAADESGPIPLAMSVVEDELRCWSVDRQTTGAIEVSYLAVAHADEPRAGTPPLELRSERGGLSGALKCFLVLPPAPEDLSFEVHVHGPTSGAWLATSSLGEVEGVDDEPWTGDALELLGDTFFMFGDLANRHHRDGELSTWWLTTPGIDIERFSERLGSTYQLMANAFGAPATPYRVFLRAHPHRGANASAHPASFVMAMNPDHPLDESSLFDTIAHELVHEWLRLDGRPEEVTWFVEGAADYYSLVLPHRAGMVDDHTFLRAVNYAARECFANPRRQLTLDEAQREFCSDFWAHRLPYGRGMFYLADLDARLRAATSGTYRVDDVVRDVVRGRSRGKSVGIQQWCALVDDVLHESETAALDSFVFAGRGSPADGSFGPSFVSTTVQVPVLDLGLDPMSVVSRRVMGLVPDGIADRAGLREAEAIDLPRLRELVDMNIGDVLEVGVTRDGEQVRIPIPLDNVTASVPQWRGRGDEPGPTTTG